MKWPKGSDRGILAAAVVGVAGALAYVGYAAAQGYPGFPLDDGWIHQTYARNLVETGAWAYVPGEVSAGSTAPLWTLALALGYALGAPFRVWTAVVGGLSLGAVAVVAGWVARRLFPGLGVGWVAALACALEWHLLWAGASGMETALFAALALAVLGGAMALARDDRARAWLGWGLLGGAAFLTRPEGLLPLGLGGACLLTVRRGDWAHGRRGAALMRYGLAVGGFLLLAVPYLLFNWKASGAILPNTFYAKQAEYREVAEAVPWLVRLMRVAGVQFVGGMVLLVPGMALAWRDIGRRRDWMGFLPLLWWAATVVLYATRLPVTYQHGRYEMPVIPALLVYGAPGTALLAARAKGRAGRILSRALALAACAVLAVFVLVGARAYLADVRIIDTEMVDVAQWLDRNTPSDALIAAHDIGAVGYFTRRRLVDLAGLVSPEVVPFIRDEGRLYEYIRARGASYLVTFPSWYPEMTARPDVVMVYQTRSPWTIQAGGDNMAVYRLR
ncbi:MAG: hypothetical protein H5T65_03055 [Chloroflexi bacterium]|nr:hypothetical protein [Chloroflexota bacterium]